MQTKRKHALVGWAFWVQWMLANTVGWIIGMMLFSLVGGLVSSTTSGLSQTVSWGIVGAVAGAIIGVNQWLVLNLFALPRGGPWARWWVIATIIGWMISLMVVVGMQVGEQLGFAVSGVVIGVSVGIAQWFVLRGEVQRAEWWGIANTVAWMLGMSAIDLLDQAVGFALSGLISGAVTGVWLLWLLRHPVLAEENAESE